MPEVALDALEAPELTEELIDRMVAGTQAQAGGRSIRELERLRDEYLLAIQQVLKQFDLGAGATLRALEERLYERMPQAPSPASMRLWRPVLAARRACSTRTCARNGSTTTAT